MKHQRHSGKAASRDVTTVAREAVQIGGLIADLMRIIQIIESDIEFQEEQARVFDTSMAEYPMLARALAARRDNLVNTVAGLERRLAELCSAELQPA